MIGVALACVVGCEAVSRDGSKPEQGGGRVVGKQWIHGCNALHVDVGG